MRNPMFARILLLAAASIAGALPAQETPSDTLLTVNHYLDYETVGEPRISPDGASIVYTRRWVNKQEDRWETALWMVNADGTENRFLVKGGSPVWSPDGTRIAYLAEGEPKGVQLFVRWMNAEGAISQLTRVERAPGNIEWSPDGRWVGFTMLAPKPEVWSIDLPAAPEGAKWTPAPRYVSALHYRADRQGFIESGFTHLYVVSADGGTPRQITHGDWNVGARFDALPGGAGWAWTPDGKSIVFDGLMDTDWDMRYRDSDINLVDVATGQARKLTSQRGTWTGPAVSPDGQWIAFSGYPAVKQTYRVQDLYVMKIDGSQVRRVTGEWDRQPDALTWASDGSGVYATAGDRGTSNIWFIPVAGGAPRQVTTGVQMLTLGSVARTGVAAIVRTAPQEPPDIWRLDLKKPASLAQLTRVNEDLLARIKLGAVEEVWYTSTNGARIQAWVVKPPSFDPSRKYPLIMEIHGGPHGMYNTGFNFSFQNFAANGYVVLYTNPRGSTGYGTDFGNAINLRYPGVDYEDLMAGVDTVINRGYVDAKRMFVGGCSGGGVLSSWVIGHTTRFAGAAVRCPVMDWLSFAGQTDIPFFTYNFFEKPFWEDPKRWLEQSSLMYVGNVQTPTVIMTGELDLRTPMPQSEEYYAALKMRGVPTALLRFAGEYHGTSSKPSNFMRTQLYMMSWYQKYGGKPIS
ncbi:MAG: Dipeptidyl-peptidase 5 [Gemmatimonadaceae bacterium]|nr:Dipeptidyl-peptidase 5 [Gemmatimonadaceae bacterium]